MQLNDLLKENGIDPIRDRVLVLRNKPNEPEFKKKFFWIAEERPDLFNAYQSTQGRAVENAFQKASYLASFIGHEPRKAVFFGLFKIGRSKPLSRKNFWRDRAHKELFDMGMKGSTTRESILKFQLHEVENFQRWKGKLIVDWPGSDRAWSRWAGKNVFSVSALLEESKFAKAMPDWTEIVLKHSDLKILPRTWQDKMSQWRGIYFIFDSVGCKGYVGSAYGGENILGRWKNYARTGHGNNKHLRRCDPDNLIFSILEVDSHVRAPNEIQEKEACWKDRLHTRHPSGLNGN